jgi:hypothetical protein
VLQYTVVLPNATHIVANAYTHSNIFWALRGGGAPSFGVITSVTYKTHENLPITAAFYIASADSDESFLKLISLWMQHHNGIADAGWGGLWPFFSNVLYLTLVSPKTLPTTAGAILALESFYNESMTVEGVNVSLAITVPYRSFQEFSNDNLVDTSKGHGLNISTYHLTGTRSYLSSWLLPRELTVPENATEVAKAFVSIPGGTPL